MSHSSMIFHEHAHFLDVPICSHIFPLKAGDFRRSRPGGAGGSATQAFASLLLFEGRVEFGSTLSRSNMFYGII